MIYGIQTTGPLEVLKWDDKKKALRAGNSWMLIESEEDLINSSISVSRLAEIWNHHNPDTPIRKFEDRELGAKQVFAILERVAVTSKKMSTAPQQPTGDEEVAKTAIKKAPAAKKAAGGKGRGNPQNLKARKSKYSGMKLHASKAAAEANPRKAGSKGHKSMEIIRKNPGIIYEDYIKKGGRGNDLEWDVTKGNVTTKG